MSQPAAFSNSVAEVYERSLVPLLFAPYAVDLARRLSGLAEGALLETAAGTGVVTRHLAAALPGPVHIVATDLSQPMLDTAARIGAARAVEWRQADAQALPFDDASFEVVVCQFGAMFWPDKVKGFAEARRVLKPGGTFLFNVWDRVEDNELAHVVDGAVSAVFGDDPPDFMRRVPHGYFDPAAIAGHLLQAGFADAPSVETVAETSVAPSARAAAAAFCQGTPMRGEIERRDPARLAACVDAAERALARRFGPGPVRGRMQAHVLSVRR